MLRITSADLVFEAELELDRAPASCAVIRTLLPLRKHVIQGRWSGESLWIPLGDNHLDLALENATSWPDPGELLLYPGGLSEVEILFPYGRTHFACKDGELAGNHFATIVRGREQLPEFGRRALWQGAQPILFELL